MFKNDHYVPILKWKMGERNGLKHVTKSSKMHVTPLLEIQPFTNANKTLEQNIKDIGKNVRESWDIDNPIFVDIDTLYNDSDVDPSILTSNGLHPVEAIIDTIESEGVSVVPVYSFFRYNFGIDYEQAIKQSVKKHGNGLCLRLTDEDFEEMNDLVKNLKQVLIDFSLSHNEIDIILDFGDISSQKYSNVLSNYLNVILNVPDLNKWRTFTICSTSFPSQLSKKVATKTNGILPRVEWIVYQDLLQKNISRFPTFGDYTVVNSAVPANFDPTYMDMAPTIKYTVDDKFLIFRGSGVKASGQGFSQVCAISKNVVSHPNYLGSNFSYGDQFIDNCANKPNSPTGNATTWVSINVNHHLELTASHFSNLGVVSTVDSL
ncbi:beta family protein [Bacillus sp. V3B]|uniref:beta family protein n=1 Tax=Bacillus sp. V3B TaxID=2804915 RepID=UPI00210A7F4B|nr:beta family protein [Bacillus sp. V3B]MCQ6275766.1 beta family protein [Bacillus sp. V3B]